MSGGHRESFTVLHVDDDARFVGLTAEWLEREDARLSVTSATNTDEAMRALDEEVDCVISDYEMPRMNGIEFLEAVREHHPDIPFILFTGKGSKEIASEAISAGVTDYLEKETGTAQYTVLANRALNAIEQYRSQQSLARSQQRLSLFVEQSPLGVIRWNDAFEAVAVNPAAEDILGYTAEELQGKSWKKIVPEHDHDAVAPVVDALLDAEGGVQSVNKNVTKSGDEITCEWHNRIVTDDEGDVVAIYSQFQDVTERQARTQAIADLHDVATELTTCSSREAVYQQAIAAAGEILEFEQAGVAVEEDGLLQVKAMSEDMPLEERPTMEPDEGIAGKTYQTGEPQLISDARANAEAQPQGDEGIRAAMSVPVGEYGLMQVIDDQPDAFDQHDLELLKLLVQHVESALARLERERELEVMTDRVEFALDVTDSVIWGVSLETGQPTLQIGPSERLYQTDVESYSDIREFFSQGIHPDDRASFESAYQQTVAGDTNEFHEVFRTHPELGPVRWIESLAYLQQSADDARLIGIATDVTDRRQRERELQRQNERLEEFARVVSHDLRNPLNVAQGCSELLSEEHERTYIEKLDRALDRMDTLVEELLALARENDHVTDTETLPLRTVCEQSWQTVETADATLTVETDRTITADISRCKQLLENLFRNAVEHGSSSVTVRVGALSDRDGFYVEDDGPGIPAGKHEAIFSAGYSTQNDGTGFGLGIVKRIADAHGWEVVATDGTAGGARFELWAVDG